MKNNTEMREAIAKALGFDSEAGLHYWGSGKDIKSFEDLCAAVAPLLPKPTTGKEFDNHNWSEGCDETKAEFLSYPQTSNDQFGYRMVKITYAWKLEMERNELRIQLEKLAKDRDENKALADRTTWNDALSHLIKYFPTALWGNTPKQAVEFAVREYGERIQKAEAEVITLRETIEKMANLPSSLSMEDPIFARKYADMQGLIGRIRARLNCENGQEEAAIIKLINEKR